MFDSCLDRIRPNFFASLPATQISASGSAARIVALSTLSPAIALAIFRLRSRSAAGCRCKPFSMKRCTKEEAGMAVMMINAVNSAEGCGIDFAVHPCHIDVDAAHDHPSNPITAVAAHLLL